jgi:hypothetical protein
MMGDNKMKNVCENLESLKKEEEPSLMDIYERLNQLEIENKCLKADKKELLEENKQLKADKDNEELHNNTNLNNNNEYKSIKKKLSYKLNEIGGKKLKDTLLLKKEKFSSIMDSDGFSLFAYSFFGITLLIGSAAILYFKAFTSETTL